MYAGKMHSMHTTKKSTSLGTIGSPVGMIDHDEIITLTRDVKRFSDTLASFKLLFTEGIGK